MSNRSNNPLENSIDMEFFAHIKTILLDSGFLSIVFIAIVFLNIVLGIPLWLSLFTYYHISPPQVELDFYNSVSILLTVTFFVLQLLPTRNFWKTFLSYFIFATVAVSLMTGFFSFRIGNFKIYQHIPPYCDIISPDGQKIYHVQNVDPSYPIAETSIRYKNWSFIEKELRGGPYGHTPWGIDFCAAKWVDNDTVLVSNDGSSADQIKPIIYKTGFEFDWVLATKFFIFYGLIILFLEILKRYKKIGKWFSSTILKQQ